jgi:two-component system chemotaxis response regulator CheY
MTVSARLLPFPAGAVLTVDDSAAVRRLVRACLEAVGFEVVEAASGAAALRLLRRRLVDLIVTDINMPGMDGYRLIETLREGLGDRATPILVLSSEEAPAMAERARAAGAGGWLVKPFTSTDLLGAVERLLASDLQG